MIEVTNCSIYVSLRFSIASLARIQSRLPIYIRLCNRARSILSLYGSTFRVGISGFWTRFLARSVHDPSKTRIVLPGRLGGCLGGTIGVKTDKVVAVGSSAELLLDCERLTGGDIQLWAIVGVGVACARGWPERVQWNSPTSEWSLSTNALQLGQ